MSLRWRLASQRLPLSCFTLVLISVVLFLVFSSPQDAPSTFTLDQLALTATAIAIVLVPLDFLGVRSAWESVLLEREIREYRDQFQRHPHEGHHARKRNSRLAWYMCLAPVGRLSIGVVLCAVLAIACGWRNFLSQSSGISFLGTAWSLCVYGSNGGFAFKAQRTRLTAFLKALLVLLLSTLLPFFVVTYFAIVGSIAAVSKTIANALYYVPLLDDQELARQISPTEVIRDWPARRGEQEDDKEAGL